MEGRERSRRGTGGIDLAGVRSHSLQPVSSRRRIALAACAVAALVPALGACGGGRRHLPAPGTRVPAPPPEEGRPEGIHHPLQRGQTLYSLSRAYGVPVETLMKVNGIIDPTTIPAGERIFIPGATRVLEIPPAGGTRLAWPLRGTVTSRFGPRGGSTHQGLDIRGRRGQRIVAAAAGRVLQAGRVGRYGKTVVIDHGNSLATRYAHASQLLVKAGDRVQRGQEIAVVGDTGNARGIHLHFEVLRQGRRLDPMLFLPR